MLRRPAAGMTQYSSGHRANCSSRGTGVTTLIGSGRESADHRCPNGIPVAVAVAVTVTHDDQIASLLLRNAGHRDVVVAVVDAQPDVVGGLVLGPIPVAVVVRD